MLDLSSQYIAEKNKLSQSGVWLILLDITLTDDVTHIRLARNTDDVWWPPEGEPGETKYQKFPFEVDDIKEEKGGEHTVLTVRVSNATRALMTYLEDEKGLVGCNVSLYVVHSDRLSLTTAAINESYIVTGTVAEINWIVFQLSAANLFNIMFPDDRYIRNWCGFRFNYPAGIDVRCGYSGDGYQECEKTLAACRSRDNSTRFGGFPGIPEGGLYSNN